ncbi:MAG: MFS transporter [Betaproteobacteria bacterium]|nr:MFS transporter [Betaproteobacteria bacterium]
MTATAGTRFETDLPARLDRLPWSRFHWLVVVALGVTWILDGLEVTIAGALTGALQESPTLRLTPGEIGLAASAYLAGAVTGAAFFGWLTDQLGRKRLFNVTLGVYLVATAATATAWDLPSFLLFRFLTGAGIGGEYTAINSAIQELIPARVRGWTDLAINGSFWVGAALGAAGSVFLLDPALFAADVGWRLAFGIGAVLGLGILLLRRWIPESPRWLMTHGRLEEAERVVAEIEARVAADQGPLPAPGPERIRIHARTGTAVRAAFRTVLVTYRQRALLGFVLMTAQAFFYNAIFFSYGLILSDHYAIPADRIGLYLLPFAVGNFLGPLLLGRLFDSIGRKAMISFTYAASGVLLAVTAVLFDRGLLDATTQTLCWMIIFFFASAAASSAYLTVSESFPLEVRAFAIALFFVLGTAIGGVIGPWLFGTLIETGARGNITMGYLLGAALMIGAAIVELLIGVNAERRSLESVAAPLSSVE